MGSMDAILDIAEVVGLNKEMVIKMRRYKRCP